MKGKFVTATPREPRNRSIMSRIRAKWFVRDLVLVSAIALVVFGALTQVFWFLAVRELDERVLVEIPEGASVRRIAVILEKHGLVRDPAKFVVATRILRQTHNLQAGTYEFGPELSELDVLLALKYGEVAGRHLTIPEGYRASQIAALLDTTLDVDPAEFMELVHDPGLMAELDVSAPSLEGFLHPDTYRFRIGTTAREAIVKMVAQTRTVFDDRRRARAD
ncbi:MAG TPA: endolytic transglycosylase MltG, partial [bacterium]|nr:endolytic transglycosylase MltG [bacterium]